MPLAKTYKKRVKFVEHIRIPRKIVRKELLDVMIIVAVIEAVILQEPLRIGVDHKNRAIERVEQYAIRGLGAHPFTDSN